MANFINWSNLPEDDLYTIKKCAEDEISKRHREKQERATSKGLEILQKMYPTINTYTKISDCKISDTEISIVFTPHIPIKNVDKPPYNLRFEIWPSDKTLYSLHVDLHTHGAMSCSGMNWFNFSAEGTEQMGPHFQYKNKKQFPEELMTIPFVKDMFYNPHQVFCTLKSIQLQ